MTPAYLIVLDRPTKEQRNAVHKCVKGNAQTGWWHRFENVWMAQGLSAQEWVGLIEPLIEEGRTSVMVFRLPHDPEVGYYGENPDVRLKWIEKRLRASGETAT